MLRSVQIATKFVAVVAVSSLMFVAADSANAQQFGRVSACQQNGTCVQPPRNVCCRPKLGFTGQVNCYGMVVHHVQYGSIACRIGLEPGDIIVRINGQRVTSQARFRQLLHEALIFNQGHLELHVKSARRYGEIVCLHARLRHTCGGGF